MVFNEITKEVLNVHITGITTLHVSHASIILTQPILNQNLTTIYYPLSLSLPLSVSFCYCLRIILSDCLWKISNLEINRLHELHTAQNVNETSIRLSRHEQYMIFNDENRSDDTFLVYKLEECTIIETLYINENNTGKLSTSALTAPNVWCV